MDLRSIDLVTCSNHCLLSASLFGTHHLFEHSKTFFHPTTFHFQLGGCVVLLHFILELCTPSICHFSQNTLDFFFVFTPGGPHYYKGLSSCLLLRDVDCVLHVISAVVMETNGTFG